MSEHQSAGALERVVRIRLEDCVVFGRLSGDVNPLHLDPTVARRVVAGKVMVHGANAALKAIDFAAEHDRGAIAGISCDFANPICVDDDIHFRIAESPREIRITAKVRSQVCMTVRLTKQAESPLQINNKA